MMGRFRMIRTLRIFSAVPVLLALHVTRMLGAGPTIGIQSGVNISWPTSTGNTYQVLWSPNPDAAPWANLGGAVLGDAMTNSLYDPVPPGLRHYQVLEIVPGSTPVASIPVNGGFEFGNGSIATNWNASSSRPPVRANLQANSGSFSMHSALTNATAAPT